MPLTDNEGRRLLDTLPMLQSINLSPSLENAGDNYAVIAVFLGYSRQVGEAQIKLMHCRDLSA